MFDFLSSFHSNGIINEFTFTSRNPQGDSKNKPKLQSKAVSTLPYYRYGNQMNTYRSVDKLNCFYKEKSLSDGYHSDDFYLGEYAGAMRKNKKNETVMVAPVEKKNPPRIENQ